MSPCEDRRSWAAISIEHSGTRFQIGASAVPVPRQQAGDVRPCPGIASGVPTAPIVYVIAMAVLALLALLVAGGVAAVVIAVRRTRGIRHLAV